MNGFKQQLFAAFSNLKFTNNDNQHRNANFVFTQTIILPV